MEPRGCCWFVKPTGIQSDPLSSQNKMYEMKRRRKIPIIVRYTSDEIENLLQIYPLAINFTFIYEIGLKTKKKQHTQSGRER